MSKICLSCSRLFRLFVHTIKNRKPSCDWFRSWSKKIYLKSLTWSKRTPPPPVSIHPDCYQTNFGHFIDLYFSWYGMQIYFFFIAIDINVLFCFCYRSHLGMFLPLDRLLEYYIEHVTIGLRYVKVMLLTRLFCRGVPGFALDCNCCVRCHGSPNRPLYVGPLF